MQILTTRILFTNFVLIHWVSNCDVVHENSHKTVFEVDIIDEKCDLEVKGIVSVILFNFEIVLHMLII
jgi:hypothetical protein